MRFVRFILLSVLTLLLLCAATAYVLVTCYKKEIVTLLTDHLRLNYGLNMSAGDVRVSLLSNWPHASVQLRDAWISTNGAQGGGYIKASAIALSVNMEKLLHRQFEVRHVSIRDGEVFLIKRDAAPVIRKKQVQVTESAGTRLSFNLEKINFRNVSFKYVFPARGQVLAFRLLGNTLRVRQYADGATGSLNGNVFVDSLRFNQRRGAFLTSTRVAENIRFSFFTGSLSLCILPGSEVEIDRQEYDVCALVRLGAEKQLALISSARKVHVEEVSALMPPKIRHTLEKFDYSKPVKARVLLVASIGKRAEPVIIIDVSGSGGKLKIGNSNVPLSDVRFSGRLVSLDPTLTHGDQEHARIYFAPVKGRVYNYPFTASVTVSSLTNPLVDITANVLVEGAKIRSRLSSEFKLGGSAVVKLRYDAPAWCLNNQQFLDQPAHLAGDVYLNDFNYREIERPYVYTVNGRAKFDKRNLRFTKLSLRSDFGDATVAGSVQGFVDYMLARANGCKTSLNVHSNELDLNPLFAAPADGNKPAEGSPAAASVARTGSRKHADHGEQPAQSRFEFDVTLNSDRITARKVRASNAKVNLHYMNGIVDVRSFQSNICEGRISGKARVSNFSHIESDIKMSEVDITELFRQFENFGQDLLASNNLKGMVSCDARFSSDLDSRMEVKGENMKADVRLRVRDGHIINYEPIQRLSNFLFKNRDFNDVAFSEIHDDFALNGYVMEIKGLEISSSILDLFIVNGKYNFRNGSTINLLVPWSNLKRRGKNFIPKLTGKQVEDVKGLKLNFSGTKDNMKIALGHREI